MQKTPITLLKQEQPPDSVVTPPSQPLQPSLGSILSGEQQQPTQIRSTREIAQPIPSKKNPPFGLIIGTLFLLVVLIGGIFFFTLNRGSYGVGSNSGTTNGSNPSTIVNGKGCNKVGILLPEAFTSTRWDSVDRPDLIKDITAALPAGSPAPDYNNAGGDSAVQQSQAEADLTKGDCILVVGASDGVAAAAIVTAAKAKNVPVIAYDRLIQSKDLDYYVSFDNVKVGQLQGQYIADHYQSYVSPGKNNLVIIDGAQTDNNALLFHQGVHSALDPLLSNDKLKTVYETFTPNWDNNTAQLEMNGALTAVQNNVSVAYVANDGMANSVIAALKTQNLNGKVLVTGQDATVAGIHNILAGDQSMTVYKAIAEEAQRTADLVKVLIAGSDTSLITNGATVKISDGTSIPSVLETPVAVDKTNIVSTVIADGYVTKDEVCQNIAAGTDGVC